MWKGNGATHGLMLFRFFALAVTFPQIHAKILELLKLPLLFILLDIHLSSEKICHGVSSSVEKRSNQFFIALCDDFQTAETGKLADAFSGEKKAKVLQPK